MGQRSLFSASFMKVVENIDVDAYKDKRVVIKGCADVEIRASSIHRYCEPFETTCSKFDVWRAM